MYNIAVFSVENILVLIFTTYPIFLYFSSKHTSFNMYKYLFFLISEVNTYFCSKHTTFNRCNTPFFLYFSGKHTSFNMYNISVFSIVDILVLIWFSVQRT